MTEVLSVDLCLGAGLYIFPPRWLIHNALSPPPGIQYPRYHFQVGVHAHRCRKMKQSAVILLNLLCLRCMFTLIANALPIRDTN